MLTIMLNKLKIHAKKGILIPILFIIIFSSIFIDVSRISQKYGDTPQNLIDDGSCSEELDQLKIATNRNNEIIDEMFDRKLSDYAALGYFPQKYEPSLEATYHALYVLNAINRLDLIDQGKTIHYIMAQFREDSQTFIDLSTLRYLDIDYSLEYYPLNSLLEAQCYALLSLDILNAMDMIDQQAFINFIWSCYNPEGDENGFIGVPWDAGLNNTTKIATMDNTYYAIQALSHLMDDWNAYGYQVARIVQFINSLQSTIGTWEIPGVQGGFGGFFNDIDMEFDSMYESFFDCNLLSAYFCLKTLETLNFIETIRIEDFHVYLDEIYDEFSECFNINTNVYESSLIGSALALELSEIVGYVQVDLTSIANLIRTNRNEMGNWDNSFHYSIHESIATYLIIQSLNNAGYLPMYTDDERDEIASATLMYYQKIQGGFSLLSRDYVSLDLIHATVSAFESYHRINELQINELHDTIEDCFLPHVFPDCIAHLFFGCTNLDEHRYGFITFPIEYSCRGKQLIMNQTTIINSVEYTFKALDSLEKLYKLDEFANLNDPTKMIKQLLNNQFLDNDYINHGAFLPSFIDQHELPEIQNLSASLQNAYFTLRCFELLTKVTEYDDLLEFSFDKIALYNYILRNLEETNKYQYFRSYRTTDPQILLRDTYFMAWILDAIQLNVLNKSKIEQFILDHLDYSNLENVYYSFKLRNLLGLHFEFNHSKTQALMESCYSEDHDFFLRENSISINQEAFMWVAEMAQDDHFSIGCTYKKELPLGAVNDITVSISNILLSDFGNEITMAFQNDELGCIYLVETINGLYQTSFQVPESADYYQEVTGVVKILKYLSIVEEIPISFKTTLTFNHEMNIVKKSNRIEAQINLSYAFYSGHHATPNSNVIAEIYSEDLDIGDFQLERKDHHDYSTYSFTYLPGSQVNYYFRFILFDDFHPEGFFLGNYDIIINDPKDPPENNPIGTMLTVGLIIGIILAIIYVIRKKSRVNVVIHNNLNETKESKASHTKNYLNSKRGER